MYESSWKYAYKEIIPQEYLDSIPTGRWADSIGKAGINNLILIEKEKIMGTASFCKSRWEKYSDYGKIVSIYFLPDYIGKGYARLFLNKCIKELKHTGLANCFCGFRKIIRGQENFIKKRICLFRSIYG